MRRRKFCNPFIVSVFLLIAFGCNENKNNSTETDTTKASSGVDSMPIVNPSIKDSGSTIITPPVNDSNVVKPDTNNNRH